MLHRRDAMIRLGQVGVGALTLPTLVVVGDRDVPDFLGMAERLATSIRGARKVVVPGAGHMVNMERPEEFNRAVLEFLER